MPLHNEAESIENTIRELYEELRASVSLEFIICEDGSRDNTKEVLARLSRQFPMQLLMSNARKGYSRAVREGMQRTTADYLLCLDGDGQCDPKDFGRFWAVRDRYDVVIGWRVNRADSCMRRTMSRGFYFVYRLLFGVAVHDPSCPFVLIRREVVERLLPRLGEMEQGFWWEFIAQAHQTRCTIQEVPVAHRVRAAGKTQVYRLGALPGIACRHFAAMFRMRFVKR